MSKKSIFLPLVVVLVAVSLGIYFNKTKARATETVYTDEARCLMETSQKLWDEHFRQATPPPAVYFIPAEANSDSSSSLKPEVLAANNILTVTSLEALQQRATQGPLRIIYLHDTALNQVNDAWLRQQYESEIAIVALNTLVSELATKLDIKTSMEDLKPELTQKYPFFVVFHKASAPAYPGTATSEGVTADFVGSTDVIPFIINRTVDTYGLTPEFRNTMDTCLK